MNENEHYASMNGAVKHIKILLKEKQQKIISYYDIHVRETDHCSEKKADMNANS